ncbi:hypothetical protein E8E14_004191 [Neopestalotiopsis sp. 37M]|nr:hypothetical protein E8E14_004191 [Neopestalotiopsis sp. 37M]
MSICRADLFSSLVLLPVANALGHLGPAIGASWAIVGRPIWDYPILILLFSVHSLADSFDKYKDIPSEKRPATIATALWVGVFMFLITWSSYVSGFASAIRIVWYLGLEVFWAIPLIPVYTSRRGFHLIKLRELFGPFKSAFVGVMAGSMDVEPASHHVCLLAHTAASRHTAGRPQHIAQALAYSILYNFLRESFYDARDIEEDKRDGVSTLATYLGMSSTIALLLAAAVAGEAWISGAVTLEGNIRAVGVVGLSSWIVTTQARENRWPWVFFSLISLLPAWHAQAHLSSGGSKNQEESFSNSFRDTPHLAHCTVTLNLAYKNAVYRAIRQRPPDLTDMKSDISIASRGQ